MMLLVRRFEERTEEQYTRARIGGYCHLAIGEEAANVGAIDCLVEGDYLFASYRDHAAALAIGSDPAAIMAELFGKRTGVAGGYGGSMHLVDVERHFLGGWGIVGGHLPIAVGAALALDYTDAPNAVLCQFGDGATNTGAFHEALNLAVIWDLPIVFQAINNLYGMGTSVEGASAEPELYKRAEAYRMLGERVDGNDLLAVREAAGRLLQRAREERKPALLETLSYRYRGHSVADAGKVYRSREEVESWRERDPIARFASRLEEQGILAPGDLDAMRKEVSPRSPPRSARPPRPRRPTSPRWPRTSTPTRRPTSSSRACASRGRSASGREPVVADLTYREAFCGALDRELDGEREGTESWRT